MTAEGRDPAESSFAECPVCERVCPVERPPFVDGLCPDGHGDECPERICTVCGTALIIGLAPVVRLRARSELGAA